MPEAEDEPGDRREHAEVAEGAHDCADFLVLGEDAPPSEENGPVAFIGADERQNGGSSIGHVSADVREVFEEPEDREGEAGGFALEEKVGGAEQRDDEFTKVPPRMWMVSPNQLKKKWPPSWMIRLA